MSDNSNGNGNGLTLLQRRFINYWFETSGNATQAAKMAGYSGDEKALAVRGSENVRKRNIWTAIEERLEQETMSSNEALWRLGQIGRMDLSPYLDEYGRLAGINLERLIADGHGHLVKGIKHTKEGTNIEFYDKQKALETILKFYKIDAPVTQVNIDQRQIKVVEVVRPSNDS
jgi:hypothetical protein